MEVPYDKGEVLTPNPIFWAMQKAAVRQLKGQVDPTERFIVSLDPGETTGIAWFQPHFEPRTIFCGQLKTKPIEAGFDAIQAVRPRTKLPVHWVAEDYKVYSWKSEDHKWADLHTPQLIGAIKCLVHLQPNDTIQFRMAQQAKEFATDDNLKKWNLYSPGLRHGRDAVRHLVHTLFFGVGQNANGGT